MREIEERCADRALGSFAVAEGERGIRRLRWAVRRLPQPERLEELRVEIRRVFLAGHLFDHHAEQDVAGVVVAVGRAGREVERVGGDELDDRVGRQFGVPGFLPLGRAGIAMDARRVIQQLVDRNAFPVQRELRHVLREVVVELQFTLVDEPHDRGGGELLGDRADLIDRRRSRRAPRGDVGQAMGSERQRVVSADDRERHARRAALGQIGIDERIGARREVRRRDARALRGSRGEGADQCDACEAGRTNHVAPE